MDASIAELAEITIGYQHRGKLTPNSIGTHRLVQIKDLERPDAGSPPAKFADDLAAPVGHRLWVGDLATVTPKHDPALYQIRNGDVLFLSRGKEFPSIPMCEHFVAPYPNRWDDIIASNHFYLLRLRTPEVRPEYLAWYLNQPCTQDQLSRLSQGSHMKMVSKRDFSKTCVEVPSWDKQERIVRLDLLQHQARRIQDRIENKRASLIRAASRMALR